MRALAKRRFSPDQAATDMAASNQSHERSRSRSALPVRIHRGFGRIVMISAWAVVSIGSSTAAAGEIAVNQDLSAKQQKLGRSLFAAIRKSRERLRSGSFEVFEQSAGMTRQGFKSVSADVSCSFDYARGFWRVDRVYRAPSNRFPKHYFITPKRTEVYVPFSRQLVFSKSVAEARNLQKKFKLKDIDPRLIGFTSRAEHQSKWSFADVYNLLLNHATLHAVAKEKDGTYRLTFRHRLGKNARYERTLWIEESKGYVPVRYEDRYFDPTTKQWSGLYNETTSTWVKRNGVWLPETMVSVRQGNRTLRYTFTWKIVNKPLPKSRFQRKDFKPAIGTTIYSIDLRTGKPVLEGKSAPQQEEGAAPAAKPK